jgi:hypothetical protein
MKTTPKKLAAIKAWKDRHPERVKASNRASQHRQHTANPDKRRKAWLRWRQNHPEQHRLSQQKTSLKRLYGLTWEEFQRWHELQGNRCAICEAETKLFVDHDHTTGLVRGLLCSNCNFGVGSLGDSAARLRRAAAYLDQSDYLNSVDLECRKV